MSGVALGRPGILQDPRARPGREAAGHLDELRDAGFLQHALERHIFAEGHEMLLVVALGRKPSPVENLNRVVVTWFAGPRSSRRARRR